MVGARCNLGKAMDELRLQPDRHRCIERLDLAMVGSSIRWLLSRCISSSQDMLQVPAASVLFARKLAAVLL